eukprot:s358_g21.t1
MSRPFNHVRLRMSAWVLGRARKYLEGKAWEQGIAPCLLAAASAEAASHAGRCALGTSRRSRDTFTYKDPYILVGGFGNFLAGLLTIGFWASAAIDLDFDNSPLALVVYSLTIHLHIALTGISWQSSWCWTLVTSLAGLGPSWTTTW